MPFLSVCQDLVFPRRELQDILPAHNEGVPAVPQLLTRRAEDFLWAAGELASYQTSLEISAKDRDGLTLDVAMALSAAKVKTTSLSARSMPDGYASVNIVLEVKNQEELSAVINKLGQIQGVYQVKRAAG